MHYERTECRQEADCDLHVSPTPTELSKESRKLFRSLVRSLADFAPGHPERVIMGVILQNLLQALRSSEHTTNAWSVSRSPSLVVAFTASSLSSLATSHTCAHSLIAHICRAALEAHT